MRKGKDCNTVSLSSSPPLSVLCAPSRFGGFLQGEVQPHSLGGVQGSHAGRSVPRELCGTPC